MKIKRYFAADMRQALNMARQEHGPDVVILGNRKVQGGVELIAADEYDEALLAAQVQDEDPAQRHGHKPGQESRHGPEPKPRQESRQRPEHRPEHKSAHKSGHKSRQKSGQQPGQVLPLNLVEAQVANRKQAARAEQAPQVSYTPIKQQQEGVIWSNEPSLEQVQQEINSLRSLLEQQMSGLAWGDIGRRHPLWAGLLRKLGGIGISADIARELVEQVPEKYGLEKAWRTILALLSYRIPIQTDNILTRDSVIAFAGASGTGKTSTIAKLATRFVLEHGAANIVLATLDSHRVGGREQLGSYARILGIPLRTIYNADDMSELMEQYYGRKLVLIDTAGLSPNDSHHLGQLTILQSAKTRPRLCLVLSGTSQSSTLKQLIGAYHSLTPKLCVLTKLDEASSLGGVLSIIMGEGLKIAYQCGGQRVPEDIKPAVATDLIAAAISMRNRYQSEFDEAQVEQDFGKYAIYNPIGTHRGH